MVFSENVLKIIAKKYTNLIFNYFRGELYDLETTAEILKNVSSMSLHLSPRYGDVRADTLF